MGAIATWKAARASSLRAATVSQFLGAVYVQILNVPLSEMVPFYVLVFSCAPNLAYRFERMWALSDFDATDL